MSNFKYDFLFILPPEPIPTEEEFEAFKKIEGTDTQQFPTPEELAFLRQWQENDESDSDTQSMVSEK
jgi:hypothetical protein